MSRQLRLKQLEHSKRRFVMLMKEKKIEHANSIVRNASFICDQLGVSVINEFSLLLRTNEEESNIIKCNYCDFEASSIHSLNAHVGRKHKNRNQNK